jgi:formylglycine-generating enzyme required for sulfatase activity
MEKEILKMSSMKRVYLLVINQSIRLLILSWIILFNSIYLPLLANGIEISNASIVDRNISELYVDIQFDISWNNSFRTSTDPSGMENWDAAWVFLKWRKSDEITESWGHGTLSNTGHSAPSGYTYSLPSDYKGIFVYRSSAGSGTANITEAIIRWNYGGTGGDDLSDQDEVDIELFAIEMVYVPEGSFYVGSGDDSGTDKCPFYTYPTNTQAYQITSENVIDVGTTVGNLYYVDDGSSLPGDQSGPIPADFPKGYHAFYTMRYEISQSQYIDFLNHLDRDQQDARTRVDISSGITSVTNRFVMSDNAAVVDRNGICCDASIHATSPVTFYANVDGDTNGNEAEDGLNIACNYLTWADFAAYLDWVALRPMTELEYEKACRGPAPAVAREYAWGSTMIHGTPMTVASRYNLSNPGEEDEVVSDVRNTFLGYAAHSNTQHMMPSYRGPLRTGIFAEAGTNRLNAGGSYWGIMELSGNIWEIVITVGNSDGRSYTGNHGDGYVSATGFADVSDWPNDPSNMGSGSGVRGGHWWLPPTYLTVSTRLYSASYTIINTHPNSTGGRGIRTLD